MTLFANNVAGTLAANINPSDTLVLLGSGQGAKFPSSVGGEYFYATIVHAVTGAVEIVKCTSRAADTLTVERGRDSTTAIAFTSGSVIEVRLVAIVLRELDYRTVRNVAQGVAGLDATAKLLAIHMPSVVPLKDGGGKIVVTDLPDAVVLTDELTAALDTKLDKTGGTLTGQVLFPSARTTGTAGFLQLGTGVRIADIDTPAVVSIRGIVNDEIGYLRLGNATLNFGWNGTKLAFGGNEMWHLGNFNPADKLDKLNPAATGNMTVVGSVTCGAAVTAYEVATPTTGFLWLNQAKTRGLSYDGTKYVFAAAAVHGLDFVSTSDRRKKKCIKAVRPVRGFADLIQLSTWKMRGTNTDGRGPVAQDVQVFAPFYVHGTDTLGIDKGGLALEAAVDLAQRVRELEAIVQQLLARAGK